MKSDMLKLKCTWLWKKVEKSTGINWKYEISCVQQQNYAHCDDDCAGKICYFAF